jgi:hypothetical protein
MHPSSFLHSFEFRREPGLARPKIAARRVPCGDFEPANGLRQLAAYGGNLTPTEA